MSAKEFSREAGLAFHDTPLRYRALTHSSYINEHPEVLEDNERLEYLGDAALDFLSAAFLFQRYPEMDEGQLTRLRAAVGAAREDEDLLDPRSLLQIWAQAELGETPRYQTVEAFGPDHAREFVVEGGVGQK